MKYLSRLLYWILSKLPEPQGKVGTLVNKILLTLQKQQRKNNGT